MSLTIKIAGTLTASDTDKREVTYLLLPYGEEGRTSAGKVTASKGSVTIPDDIAKVGLNFEHDFTRPVGKATLIEETDAGLVATFRIARTRAGDDLLEEVAEGLRASASVEVEDPVIRGGRLIAGLLTGAGAVVRPAFPSATAQLVASDCGDTEDTSADPDSALTDESAEAITTEDETPSEETEKEEHMENTNAAAPADLMVASRSGASKDLNLADPREVVRLIAAAHANPGDATLYAALSDVTQTGGYNNMAVPQYLGRLWQDRTYVSKYAPLINHGDLTAMKLITWKFDSLPQVADYAGNKAEIASNTVTTSTQSVDAARLAAGWDCDRIFVDFPNPEFWSAFLAAANDDYARKIDAKVLTRLKSDAVAVTGAGSGAVAKLIKGVRALDAQEVGLPTYALMGWNLYEEYLATTNNNVAVFLSQALGLEEGSFENFRIVPTSDTDLLNKVLVGTKASHTLFERPGSPLWVDALDLARGGVDKGIFGYYAIQFHGKGLVSVA